ncbi:MAG: 4Fe-4S binding protein [Synergistaceae bacterium]|nr:4Fe-4S binding protein [Synergistaceae bacterium]
MSKPQCWQEVPMGTVAFGASALDVQTGLWRSMRPVIDTEKCVSCLRCWIQCPDDSIELDAEGKVRGIKLFFCKGCGLCEKLCPTKAISMLSESSFADAQQPSGEHPGEVGAHVR